MKKNRALCGFIALHAAGWALGYLNSYMLRNATSVYADNAWWGAPVTAFLSIMLITVGGIGVIASYD